MGDGMNLRAALEVIGLFLFAFAITVYVLTH